MVIICFEIPALCALLALVRPLSIGLILYIYIEREIDFVVGRVWGGGTRHLARFLFVCSALSPPVKLKSVDKLTILTAPPFTL